MAIEYFPKLAALLERMQWDAREVVRDIDGKPQLWLRLRLQGPVFTHRALEPIVTVGGVTSRCVEIASDGLSVHAYFDRLPPEGAVIEFGYEDGVLYRFPRVFHREGIHVLDHQRLPKGLRPLSP